MARVRARSSAASGVRPSDTASSGAVGNGIGKSTVCASNVRFASRLLEIVVHADDLAASLDLATPRFEPEVLDPVLGLMAALSQRRHGQDAVVRTLARAERAVGSISAF